MRVLLAVLLLICATDAFAAWAAVGTIANVNSTSSESSWAPVTSAQLDAGNVGVCVVAFDEIGAGTTDGDNSQITNFQDAASNTWVKAGEFCNMQTNTVANGACVDIWYTKAASNLALGAAITVTFSDVTTAKAMTCMEFTVTAGATISETAGENGAPYDGADPGALTVATGVAAEHLFIRGNASETDDDTYTADADYTAFVGQGLSSTADPGADGVSMSARAEYRIASEASAASSDPSYNSLDHASYMIGLNEAAAGGTRRIIVSKNHTEAESVAK